MSELISEIEAFTAWKNGQAVEIYDESMCWHPLLRDHGLCVFDSNGRVKFRLKPRTITINGIEVPACGVDYKPHTFMFVLNSLDPCEYSKIILDESDEIPPYWWSTEEEIKQVVAALRQVFGGSHDN